MVAPPHRKGMKMPAPAFAAWMVPLSAFLSFQAVGSVSDSLLYAMYALPPTWERLPVQAQGLQRKQYGLKSNYLFHRLFH